MPAETQERKENLSQPGDLEDAAGRFYLHEGERKMPSIVKEVSVAAGASNDNVFQGSAYEFARSNSIVSVGVGQSATGGFATLQAGPQIVAEEFSVPILTRFPIIPDEFYFNVGMAVGDRLVLRYRNPTAGALTVRAIANLTEV